MKTYNKPISLNKAANSPFWMVTFVGADGRQKRRSTKVPHAGGMFLGEKLSRAQAEKRAMFVAYEIATAEEEHFQAQDNMTVRQLFDSVLERKKNSVAMATFENAAASYRQFCAWFGARASAPLRLVTKADMTAWAEARRAEVRCKTVRKDLCALSSAFGWAVDAGIVTKNPCRGVRVAPDSGQEKVVHEAFSVGEIRLLLEKLPDEWASAVRCCIGTYGQRLGDIVALRWEQFDWQARVVRMVTGKTGTVLAQPMKRGFYDWARSRFEAAQAQGGEAAVWVHPRLRKHSNPSPEFTQLVRLHGIGLVGADAGGKRRTWHSKTFHCLRASAVTMLHVAGVSQGLAMKLVGHDSALVHEIYLRPTSAQLAEAADMLPDL